MDEQLAKKNVVETFENEFDEGRFKYFARNLFIGLQEKAINLPVTSPFDATIEKAVRIGTYTDPAKNDIHVLIVVLKRERSIEYARTTQRNFVAKYLNDLVIDAALVAFYSENSSRWRLSFIERVYSLKNKKDESSPAKRFSYQLGKNESSYTAQKQFLEFFTKSKDEHLISLADLQDIFSIEKVTDEFFDGFLKVFNQLWKHLLNQIKNQRDDYVEISKETTLQILNRLLFVYFIQRKSEWFDFIPEDKRLIDFLVAEYKISQQPADTFFSRWIKVLFLETFNNRKTLLNTVQRNYFPENVRAVLHKMPYLNGGLFSENEYDELEFSIPDRLMIDEIIAFLNTYNFTIIESMPLDKEVAINPEVIGTIYEKFVNLETTPELKEKYETVGSSKGIIYTQEDEINLMCRKAMIHYLNNNFDLPLEMIYDFVFDEEFFLADISHYETLKQAITNVKIVDPACGSGSFLVGMVNLLHELHKKLLQFNPEENPKDYAIRKQIIENNVYGVDIMEWAVKIAELRLWLFLIVESDLKWTELQLTPLLPNLSFKIRQGDSLIEEIGDVDFSAIRENRFILSPLKRKINELKKEKLRYTKNEKGHKSKQEIEKMERDIYRNLIRERITTIRNEIVRIRKQEIAGTGALFADIKEGKAEQKDLFEKQKQEKLAALQHDLAHWQQVSAAFSKDVKPFVWDIDFAEIFLDDSQKGFDIVIGNPPYVRQEKIAPPRLNEKNYSDSEWREQKKAYKTKLQNMVANLYGKIFKPDGKADLYVYFYFKALSLLNARGAFAFITSNSWLDVGFGKSLQEFLLKRVKIYSINDNQAKRSFKEADVNTIIIFTSAPSKNEKENLEHTAKFVMFKKPFALAVTKENLQKIDQTELTVFDKDLTELVDNVVNCNDFRIFPIRQSDLFNDGAREDGGLKIYEGNKWGGKFLRAPDIFFTILKKGKNYINNFDNYFIGERYLNTGGADGFFIITKFKEVGDFYIIFNSKINKGLIPFEGKIEKYYLKPLIKDITKRKKFIEINKTDALCLVIEGKTSKLVKNYIKWGEKNGYHKRSVTISQKPWYKPTRQMFVGAEILLPRSFNDTFIIHYNPMKYLSLRYYRLHIKKGNPKQLVSFLNSTLFWFLFETLGNKNLGQGVLDFFMAQFLSMKIPIVLNNKFEHIFRNLARREIKSIFTELGFDRDLPIRSQQPNPLPDRKALDDIVFDALGLTEDERKEVYWAVAELVKNRLDKARSV